MRCLQSSSAEKGKRCSLRAESDIAYCILYCQCTRSRCGTGPSQCVAAVLECTLRQPCDRPLASNVARAHGPTRRRSCNLPSVYGSSLANAARRSRVWSGTIRRDRWRSARLAWMSPWLRCSRRAQRRISWYPAVPICCTGTLYLYCAVELDGILLCPQPAHTHSVFGATSGSATIASRARR